MSNALLEVSNLYKYFGKRLVLKNLSFDISEGEIIGFIGRNGSGKSTTMRSIVGLLDFEQGKVLLNNEVVSKSNSNLIGYMPEERGLLQKEDIESQVKYFGYLRGLSRPDFYEKFEELLSRLNLSGKQRTVVGKLSLGNQQRVQLLIALLHDPKLLVLDEPFSGLDPIATKSFSNILKERAKRGVATLFSSHQLSLVEELCSRVIIIQDGEIIINDRISNLRNADAPVYLFESRSLPMDWLREFESQGIREVDRTESTVKVEFPISMEGRGQQLVLAKALEFGAVREFRRISPPLSEIYERYVI